MPARSYDQFCPAARALDVVGERWALLIVRDLLRGPKRYTDLARGLPGIGPNVLAGRLKGLERHGVVSRRELPPPAASTVYELTELGQRLQPVLQELFRWGLNFMGEPGSRDRVRLDWLLAAMQASFSPDAARGVAESYELRVDDQVLHLVVDDGRLDLGYGPADDPAVVVSTDLETLLAIAMRRLDPEDAQIEVAGEADAARRCREMFNPLPLPEPEPEPLSEPARA